MLKIFVTCIHFLFTRFFFSPTRKHDMMLLFLNKPDSRLMRAKHACASNMHCARVGKHLLSEVRVYSN